MRYQRMVWPRASVLTLFLSAFCGRSIAATPPDAGQLLPLLPSTQIKPATPDSKVPLVVERPARTTPLPSGEQRISVSRLGITGNTLFRERELLDLLGDTLATPQADAGRPRQLSLTDLQGLADRITAHYRDQGYLLAHAYLPAQDVVDGQVVIAVLEGQLSGVRLNNQSRHGDATVRERLAGIALDTPLYAPRLERSLLLLSDLPGSSAQATLKPGASVGTSELDIQVRSLRHAGLFSGDVSLDNQGSPSTGEYRLGAGVTLNSPLHLGDTLELRLLGAGKGFHYGRLAWQVPIGQDGLRFGMAASSMDYRLGKDFASLQAHGKARIFGVYGIYPLVRSRFTNVNVQLAYDRTLLDDRVDSNQSITTKTVDVVQTGLSGSHYDTRGGLTVGSLNLVSGSLELDAAALATDANGLRTAGQYRKVSLQLARTQRLGAGWNLRGQASGQAAQKNLSSSEKFSLGGSQAVRAYPQGEAPSDDGWLATVEVIYTPAPQWQVSVFHDAAQGKAQHAPEASAVGGNKRHLGGYGLGLNFASEGGLALQASMAWRSSGPPASGADRTPRTWLRLVQSF